MKSITFSNGDQMPIIGLGTWKSKPGEVYQAVLWAIEAGYRHIDCAAIYDNEKEVGNALDKAFKDGVVKREELFITSKLWNSNHRLDDVVPALKKTLKDLQLECLDLYLIHWPISFKKGVLFAQTREEFYTYGDVPLSQTWEGMEEVKKMGLAKHIGVSNFNITKLEEIIKSSQFAPEMNQVEMHPFLPQDKLVNFCRSKNILMTAYSPLGSGDRATANKKANEPSLLENEVVKEIASKHRVSSAQILISYSVHRNIAVIPKSVNQDRIVQNLASIEVNLDEIDMQKLANIGTAYRFIDGSFFTGTQSPYKLTDLWEKE
ncbi:aldo/keto reductase [Aquiflexum gelatinilyticum]|uniref:aldo/keto reductase n=1 Tax=Aquiflexum gelatinilyticum TaxID=2961943 RepID=UPI00216A74FD|nr:aldo/keto reductase [Aquiflexum gelatinilyticum]MCS4432799.1 aldo/keto reductase [Aquiflexum gelatinilyticum]